MKKLFLLGIGGFAIVWLAGFFLYRVVLSFVDIYDDWQLGKELREIEADAARRRQESQEEQ